MSAVKKPAAPGGAAAERGTAGVEALRWACTSLGLGWPPPPALASAAAALAQPAPSALTLSPPADEVAAAAAAPAARALCSALARGASVSALCLAHARAGDAGARAVAEVLRAGRVAAPALVLIDLSGCELTAAAGAALGSALAAAAASSTSLPLRTLRLDYNDAVGGGIAPLAAGLAAHGGVRVLSLAYCGLGVACAEALAAAVSRRGGGWPLEALSVAGNCRLGAAGIAALARGAAASETLADLDLRDTGLGSSALGAYAALLPPAVVAAAAAAAAAAASPRTDGDGSVRSGSATAESGGVPVSPAAPASSAAAAPAAARSMCTPLTLPPADAPEPSAADAGGHYTRAVAAAAATSIAACRAALAELGCAMTAMRSVDLRGNALLPVEAGALVPYVQGNEQLQTLRVDTSLPADIFAALNRCPPPPTPARKAAGTAA